MAFSKASRCSMGNAFAKSRSRVFSAVCNASGNSLGKRSGRVVGFWASVVVIALAPHWGEIGPASVFLQAAQDRLFQEKMKQEKLNLQEKKVREEELKLKAKKRPTSRKSNWMKS